MTESLHHRGPDSSGYYDSPPFTAGMRRLSINDVAHGDQPLFNTSRDVALVYNGEIYNYPALRRKLEARGYVFRTNCDGEVICHLYDEVGDALFEQLDGMYAVALWSNRERKLILARDIPGEKPLYYSVLPDGGIAFASEMRALRHFPGLTLTLDRQALWDFPTFLWIPEPDTAYREVKALPKGSLLVADAKGIAISPIQNRFNSTALVDNSSAGVISETRRVVTEAVESRLLSDVPVGSFLSSGLDSSIVATLASQKLGKLSTFSIGFENVSDPYHGTADESPAAQELAARLGTDHHVIRVTAQTFRDKLETFCRHGDQPFAVSSGLGILTVAEAARDHGIRVLLSGDGADESFGGYSWYPYLNTRREKATQRCGSPVSFQNTGLALDQRLDVLASYPTAKRAWAWHYYAAESEKAGLFAPEAFSGAESSLRWFSGHKSANDWSPEDYVKQDREFYLPNEMMRKLDRMTMAHSVEGRAPFVAPAVLAHADKLRYRDLVQGAVLKPALRAAFADILPESVTTRPKHGFNVPIDHWLKGVWSDLVARTFAPSSALSRAGLLAKNAANIADEMLHDKTRLNGHTIFCFVMLDMWLETNRA